MTAALNHNGGRSQVNLNLLQIGGDYAFINMCKMGQEWTYSDNSAQVNPSQLDANGYPLATPMSPLGNPGIFNICTLPTQTERPGDWVITWDGNGTISAPAGTATGGSITSTGGSGFYRFTPSTTRCLWGILTVGSPHITNLCLQHIDDYNAGLIVAGQIFTTKFLNRLKQANFGTIRFLNWQAGNTTNVATWSMQRDPGYAYYAGSEFRASIYAGIPSISGNAYSVASPPGGFSLTNGATVMVGWRGVTAPSNGTAQITLNVGGTGNVQIISALSAVMTGSFYPAQNGGYSTLVYDAELNAFVDHLNGIDSGAPIPICVELCAEVGAHIHLVTPILAAENDWSTGAATYTKTNAPSWMKYIQEGPNEDWNPQAAVNQVWFSWLKQSVRNGISTTALGVPVSISATAAVTSAASGSGFSDITLTGSQPFLVGSRAVLTGFTGLTNFSGFIPWVTAINVGGNSQKITVNQPIGPGSYTGSGGQLTPFANDNHSWYGQAIGKIGQAVNAVYGGTPSTQTAYDVLCGVQTATGFGGGAVASDERLKATGYVLRGGSAANNWVTGLACANYFTPTAYGTLQEMEDAFNYTVTDAGNPTARAALAAAYVDTLGGSAAPFNIAYVSSALASWKSWALGFSPPVKKMRGYEGGYSPDYSGTAGGFFSDPFYSGILLAISGATQASSCVLTIHNCSTVSNNNQFTGHPVVAGMMLDIDGITAGMTQLNCKSYANLTFTQGSPTIGAANNTMIAGQVVSFTSFFGLPPELDTTKHYFILASGLVQGASGSFQISETAGGAAITLATAPSDTTLTAQSGWLVKSVSGDSVTISVDSTAFTAWNVSDNSVLAFPAAPFNPTAARATIDSCNLYLNLYRSATKLVSSSPAKPSGGLADWLTDNYNGMIGLTDGTFTAEAPSCFQMTGNTPSESAWSVLEDIYQTPDPPQWLAIVAFNQTRRAINLRLRIHG